MKQEFKVKWSKLSIMVTITVSVIVTIIGILLFLDSNWADSKKEYILILLIIGLLGIVCIVPTKIILTSDYLYIKRIIGSKKVITSEITEVGLCYSRGMSIKVCGSGGFCGSIGWYKDPCLGVYFSYVMNWNQAFYIILKNGKKYMLSCENPDDVIRILKNQTHN
jgi:hypothetical protein